MCGETVKTVIKVLGLFFLLEGILFAFLFVSFFREYELNMRILSSGYVSVLVSTLIWIVVLLIIHKEEKPQQFEDEEFQEDLEQELIAV